MRIRSAGSASKSQQTQSVAPAAAQQAGGAAGFTDLGQEFRRVMANLAQGGAASELSLDTFAVEPLKAPEESAVIETPPAELLRLQQLVAVNREPARAERSDTPTATDQEMADNTPKDPQSFREQHTEAAPKQEQLATQGAPAAVEMVKAEPQPVAQMQTGSPAVATHPGTAQEEIPQEAEIAAQLPEQAEVPPPTGAPKQAANSADRGSKVSTAAAPESATTAPAPEAKPATEESLTAKNISNQLGQSERSNKDNGATTAQPTLASQPALPESAPATPNNPKPAPNQSVRELLAQAARALDAMGHSPHQSGAATGITPQLGATQPLGATMGSTQNGGRSNESQRAAPARALTPRDATRALEKVENALQEAARSRDGRTLSFRLDPPDLGAVKIDVSIREGNLHARLSAESSQVAQLLKEKAHDLQSVLRKLGLAVDQVTVAVHEQNTPGFNFTAQKDSAGQQETRRSNAQGMGRNGEGSNAVPVVGVPKSAVTTLDHWVA